MYFLPYAMSIGVDYDLFWTLNPHTLKPFEKAYKLKREMQDEQAWMMGAYVYEAFSVVMANAFSKKGAKKQKYRDKPLLYNYEEETKPLTIEDKIAQTESLFARLEAMKNKFEANKQNKSGGDD